MHIPYPGRHEFGQNFLVCQATIAAIVELVADTHGPIVEIGAGDGALTFPLERLGRPLTCIEVDPRRAQRLSARVGEATSVECVNVLAHRLPGHRHVVVGNLPFHLTTKIFRKILAAPGWTEAVLMVQWEVARRRAAVGGASLLTAQSWPWFDFSLEGRVPSTAFRPRPDVDGGLIVMRRRQRPLVAHADRDAYRRFVRAAFTGSGRGLAQTLGGGLSREERMALARWLSDRGISPKAQPRRLTAQQWADVFHRFGMPGPRRHRHRS